AESRQVAVATMSRELKLLAKEFQLVVVVLCQLNRASEQRTDNGVNGLLRLVYRKLGARSAAHAVALAMARGLITPNDLAEP
ncbi:hypothetical protein KBZ21_41165, partial [Streptomyces sp. A73]|nr:hypothetical protein [Streptomyces sp. A73]